MSGIFSSWGTASEMELYIIRWTNDILNVIMMEPIVKNYLNAPLHRDDGTKEIRGRKTNPKHK